MLDMNAPYDPARTASSSRRLVEPHRNFLARGAAALGICSPLISPGSPRRRRSPWRHGERELTRFTVRDFITLGAIRYVQFRRDPRRRLLPKPCASPRSPSSMASWSRRIPRRRSTAISFLPAALRLRRRIAWRSRDRPAPPMASSGQHPELRDGYIHIGDQPGFGLDPIGLSSSAIRCSA